MISPISSAISSSQSLPDSGLPLQRVSSHLLRSLAAAAPPSSRAPNSLPEQDKELILEDGLRHANTKLEARHYKTDSFTIDLLNILTVLWVPGWYSCRLAPQHIRIKKVSGSLTNAVFFVSSPSMPTLLLRIYGPSSGSLISRPRELHNLHVLSSQYHIGPRVYGTFGNGRVEEYFDSVTLTASDIRNDQISRWIGARMAELHFVDIDAVEGTLSVDEAGNKGWEIGAKQNVKSWLGLAREVLALPSVSDTTQKELDLDTFQFQWERYMRWLSDTERVEGHSRIVFAHNDAQYGNLLRLNKLKAGTPDHRQIIVVDFEYASPNPAAFDIANHFHEWTANYHSSLPHILDPSRYPSSEERRNFFSSYLEHAVLSPPLSSPLSSTIPFHKLSADARECALQRLEHQVRIWSPASHAMWAVWGIVQAREDLEGEVADLEFDYIGYAKSRMEGFRREINALGL